MQDPINFKLTRTSARTWIFSLATAFSVVEVPILCEFSMMSSKRNRETGSCDHEIGVWKKNRCHEVGAGVWKKKRCHQVRSILRPSHSSDLRDKGRSTLSVPCVKLIIFPTDHWDTYDTASHKLPQKGNETHTHTQTGWAANCCGSLINLCYRQNGATLTPSGLRSLLKKKSIFISFLAIKR